MSFNIPSINGIFGMPSDGSQRRQTFHAELHNVFNRFDGVNNHTGAGYQSQMAHVPNPAQQPHSNGDFAQQAAAHPSPVPQSQPNAHSQEQPVTPPRADPELDRGLDAPLASMIAPVSNHYLPQQSNANSQEQPVASPRADPEIHPELDQELDDLLAYLLEPAGDLSRPQQVAVATNPSQQFNGVHHSSQQSGGIPQLFQQRNRIAAPLQQQGGVGPLVQQPNGRSGPNAGVLKPEADNPPPMASELDLSGMTEEQAQAEIREARKKRKRWSDHHNNIRRKSGLPVNRNKPVKVTKAPSPAVMAPSPALQEPSFAIQDGIIQNGPQVEELRDPYFDILDEIPDGPARPLIPFTPEEEEEIRLFWGEAGVPH
ncbi:hypothetical protein QBC40DRAFT_291623 [Triangularia verruculosa]|uniref:Uncharacterized protein n=1 Tax=Triangularia verruculosa TaxID=2587418 RepID=A0AAN6XW28_9PEZI|nr:hypothetical protein QBC40DRAFT_291623 [Triangularia verruculosa]